MPERALARPSIRRRLFAFLVVSLLAVVSAAAVVTYWIAHDAANAAYDRSLLDPAFDIADNIVVDEAGAHVDLPPKALQLLFASQADEVLFQVRDPEDDVIAGVPDLPPPPPVAAGDHAYFDRIRAGERFRIAALRARNGYVIQVGETVHKRNKLVGEILLAELVPTILIAVGTIALGWLAVSRGLVPLEHLRRELIVRAPNDLRPLSETGSPIEVAPVVDAFNRLLGNLREAQRSEQRFLANAAHQLRTPLAGLQMHLELLLRRPLPRDVQAELERMHGATVRASRLANQLLALAKAESAREHQSELETIDLRAVADEAARGWTARAIEQDIDLGFALDRALVLGDRVLLPELVDNLIDNALRYTPSGGAVTVRTWTEGECAFLAVEDTGPGIPAEERGNVLERFYRMPGTRSEGSGLGLAIVREVAERHGATLAIEDGPGGKGTRVKARFRALQVSEVREQGSETAR